MTRLAVFDCDGTLVDGQAAVCDAMDAAFAAAGLTLPDRNRVRRIVGLSLPQAVRVLAPDAEADRQTAAVDAYKASFRATREQGRLEEPLFEGIAALLHALRDNGWQLAVATGKSDRGLAACLAAHGIADLFISLQTADRHPSKPHPAMLEAALFEAAAQPGDAVMIGDTTFDIDMARAAGVRAIGVAWGYHAPAELIAAGAEAVAATCAELEGLLQ
ncbi:HAD family hydrolase [Altererythrobacter sp. FM1]|uniref:HAD-IA family hydrolase n=1 Tax=Tsuneonella flava TaxID=2055955 RepID=A0ABX7KAL1_9SPHN|nr:HAD-IA family hydrolase [Tsuneonella flava]QSB44562.1 HAD-IA family hydrolase [Tsuneonella flava]ROT93874.1 HAD family hydrolase [Altererythrobacter sp. FM1]UBS32993.1 HAD-IA family hydrolase [Altererythrobacter sp. N1]